MRTAQLTARSTEHEARRFATLLRTATDGSRGVAGSAWTVGELGAHVLSGLEEYRNLLEGGGPLAPSPDAMADNNRRLLTIFSERDPRVLADRIETASGALVAAVQGLPAGAELAWYGNVRLPAAALLAILTSESALHGRDLARTLGAPWPLDRAVALEVLCALAPAMPAFVDEQAAAGFTGSYRVSLRGGADIDFRFVAGRLTTAVDGRGPVDCRISADPASFLLASYKRIGPLRAAATGGMVAHGRKPWLALRFASLFRTV